MFLTCELALYMKLVLKCVKSAPVALFPPSCFDVPPAVDHFRAGLLHLLHGGGSPL